MAVQFRKGTKEKNIMKKETKSGVVAPEKIVGKVDFARLYDNKLSTNIKDLKDNKKVKATILEFLRDIVAQNIDKNKNFKEGKIVVKLGNTELVERVKSVISYATTFKVEDITDKALVKATISAIKNKFVRGEDKGTKVDSYAYSVSDFLKSINASVIKTISK